MNRVGCRETDNATSRWLAIVRTRLRDERGIGLAETLVAITIIGITMVTFITVLSTGTLAVRESEQEAIAQQLIRSQLEYLKSLLYDATGDTYQTIDTPSGYTISVETDATIYSDTNIQELTVTVYRDGKAILTVAAYKVNR